MIYYASANFPRIQLFVVEKFPPPFVFISQKKMWKLHQRYRLGFWAQWTQRVGWIKFYASALKRNVMLCGDACNNNNFQRQELFHARVVPIVPSPRDINSSPWNNEWYFVIICCSFTASLSIWQALCWRFCGHVVYVDFNAWLATRIFVAKAEY